MLKEDFVIQSTVRRVLVRSHIEYSRLTFGTVKGVVYLQGMFEVSRYYTDGSAESMMEFAMKTLASLEKKIRGIPGVTDVNFKFLNWRKDKGQWIPKKEIED